MKEEIQIYNIKKPSEMVINNDNYSLIDDSQIRGGCKIVNNIVERNEIPLDKRGFGVVKYRNSNDNTGEWIIGSYIGSDLSDENWSNNDNWSLNDLKISITPTINLGGAIKNVTYENKTNEDLWNILLRPYVYGSYSFTINYGTPETNSIYGSNYVVEKGYYTEITSITINNVADSNGDLMNSLLLKVNNPESTTIEMFTTGLTNPISGTSTIQALSDTNQNRVSWTTSNSSDTWKIYGSGINADDSTFTNTLIGSIRFYDIALFGAYNAIITSGNSQTILDSIRSSETNTFGKRICTTKTQTYKTTDNFNVSGYYGYICYPSIFGKLSSIKFNNAEENLTAWVDCGLFNYTNPKGLITEMQIYRTSVDQAYQSQQLLYCS